MPKFYVSVKTEIEICTSEHETEESALKDAEEITYPVAIFWLLQGLMQQTSAEVVIVGIDTESGKAISEKRITVSK